MGSGLRMGRSEEGLPPTSRRQERAGEEKQTSKLMGSQLSLGYKDALTTTADLGLGSTSFMGRI